MGPKLDEFEVISTIGSGAHGLVRKIRRKKDDKIMVWKELHYGAMSEAEKQVNLYNIFEINIYYSYY